MLALASHDAYLVSKPNSKCKRSWKDDGTIDRNPEVVGSGGHTYQLLEPFPYVRGREYHTLS